MASTSFLAPPFPSIDTPETTKESQKSSLLKLPIEIHGNIIAFVELFSDQLKFAKILSHYYGTNGMTTILVEANPDMLHNGELMGCIFKSAAFRGDTHLPALLPEHNDYGNETGTARSYQGLIRKAKKQKDSTGENILRAIQRKKTFKHRRSTILQSRAHRLGKDRPIRQAKRRIGLLLSDNRTYDQVLSNTAPQSEIFMLIKQCRREDEEIAVKERYKVVRNTFDAVLNDRTTMFSTCRGCLESVPYGNEPSLRLCKRCIVFYCTQPSPGTWFKNWIYREYRSSILDILHDGNSEMAPHVRSNLKRKFHSVAAIILRIFQEYDSEIIRVCMDLLQAVCECGWPLSNFVLMVMQWLRVHIDLDSLPTESSIENAGLTWDPSIGEISHLFWKSFHEDANLGSQHTRDVVMYDAIRRWGDDKRMIVPLSSKHLKDTSYMPKLLRELDEDGYLEFVDKRDPMPVLPDAQWNNSMAFYFDQ